MKQLIRFSLVGCANFSISYTVFLLSYHYWPFSRILATLPLPLANVCQTGLQLTGVSSIDAAVANLIGFVAGMANSFVLNKLWTFEVREGTRSQAQRFIATNLLCLGLSTVSLFIGTDLNHLPHTPVWIGSMAGVTIINFWLSKHWVFAHKAPQTQKGIQDFNS